MIGDIAHVLHRKEEREDAPTHAIGNNDRTHATDDATVPRLVLVDNQMNGVHIKVTLIIIIETIHAIMVVLQTTTTISIVPVATMACQQRKGSGGWPRWK